MNCCQLWPERRVRRVSCPQFWPVFTTVWPDFPTSELQSPSSCEPTSAQKQCCQCQIVLSTCANCELLWTLTWKKGQWVTVCANLTSFCSAVSVLTWKFWLDAHCQSHAVIDRFESLFGLANQTEPIGSDRFGSVWNQSFRFQGLVMSAPQQPEFCHGFHKNYEKRTATLILLLFCRKNQKPQSSWGKLTFFRG